MRSCRETARLASERMDRDLGTGERVALWLHLMMCRHCRRYAAQLKLLRRAARRVLERDAHKPGADGRLSAEARARIADRLSRSRAQDGDDAGPAG